MSLKTSRIVSRLTHNVTFCYQKGLLTMESEAGAAPPKQCPSGLAMPHFKSLANRLLACAACVLRAVSTQDLWVHRECPPGVYTRSWGVRGWPTRIAAGWL